LNKREGAREALPTIWRVPDELWTIAEPILRPAEHPKGGRPWMDTRRALDGVLVCVADGLPVASPASRVWLGNHGA
jgi:transposase